MRGYLTSIITVIAFLVGAGASSGMVPQGEEGFVSFRIIKSERSEPIEENEEGHRIPSRLNATISYSGVSIPGVEEGEILSYEACDEAGDCMAIFTDEAAFIEYFFSTEEISMVRFTTASYVYTGWL